jgi:hypothetical protein
VRSLIADFKADWIEATTEIQRLKQRLGQVIAWLKEPLK